jgi:PBSX family phage portal protein
MDQPPRERVAQAIADARANDDGKGTVMKVLFMDDAGNPVGEWASSQLPEDPFNSQNISGLKEPPFSLPQLVYLAETHPVHSAALEQKTADICGQGWEWQAEDEDNADQKQRDDLEAWFNSLAPDEMDMKEVIEAAWLDVETTGWGLLELARDPQGVVRRIYQVPGHTVRAHKDGFRLCQIREDRKIWFSRWGSPWVDGAKVEVDMKTGSKTKITEPGNDLFVIKKPSRRSTWYGIPGYVSSIGWITLALAARDDNLMFFANRREPRWAIILTNLNEDAGIEEELRNAFTVDLRQPYRNIIVPIHGPGDVHFEKLGDSKQDGSFEKLSERADKAIMISHRVPAERLANASIGPLGGTATIEASKIYKEGVVAPGQELLQTRLNKLIDVEFPISQAGGLKPAAQKRKLRKDAGQPEDELPQWNLVMDDLDLSSDREDLDQVVIAFHGNLINLREARHKLKLDPLMRKIMPPVTPPPPPEMSPDEPVLDPLTGKPKMDPVTGKPMMTPGKPIPDMTPPEPPPSPEQALGEEESPYNEMLFTELPGSSGASGLPGAMVPGTGGLKEPKFGSRDVPDPLAAIARELLTAARENSDRIAELAAASDE